MSFSDGPSSILALRATDTDIRISEPKSLSLLRKVFGITESEIDKVRKDGVLT